MKVGSIFAGIGGFDLGFEQAGISIAWQCEKDRQCQKLLHSKWPSCEIVPTVQEAVTRELSPVDVICGGDPCPIRSAARGSRPSKSPDLSGYFLALVSRCRPEWLVRENVPASDVRDFIAALGVLGYRTVIVELNARHFTAQSRRRQFIVGSLRTGSCELRAMFSQRQCLERVLKTDDTPPPTAYCLTTHPCRWSDKDTYIGFPSSIRVPTPLERERLQGFPDGWTEGYKYRTRCRMLGNAVNVGCSRWIGERIMRMHHGGNGLEIAESEGA